jgi:hypothetical protein
VSQSYDKPILRGQVVSFAGLVGENSWRRFYVTERADDAGFLGGGGCTGNLVFLGCFFYNVDDLLAHATLDQVLDVLVDFGVGEVSGVGDLDRI